MRALHLYSVSLWQISQHMRSSQSSTHLGAPLQPAAGGGLQATAVPHNDAAAAAPRHNAFQHARRKAAPHCVGSGRQGNGRAVAGCAWRKHTSHRIAETALPSALYCASLLKHILLPSPVDEQALLRLGSRPVDDGQLSCLHRHRQPPPVPPPLGWRRAVRRPEGRCSTWPGHPAGLPRRKLPQGHSGGAAAVWEQRQRLSALLQSPAVS